MIRRRHRRRRCGRLVLIHALLRRRRPDLRRLVHRDERSDLIRVPQNLRLVGGEDRAILDGRILRDEPVAGLRVEKIIGSVSALLSRAHQHRVSFAGWKGNVNLRRSWQCRGTRNPST